MILFETKIVFSSTEWYAFGKEESILVSGVMVCLTAEFVN